MFIETDEEYFVRDAMPIAEQAKASNRLMQPFSTLKEYELFRYCVGLGKHRPPEKLIDEEKLA